LRFAAFSGCQRPQLISLFLPHFPCKNGIASRIDSRSSSLFTPNFLIKSAIFLDFTAIVTHGISPSPAKTLSIRGLSM